MINIDTYDLEVLRSYISWHGESCGSVCDMKHFLQYWRENKKALYHIFNENLILEKEICFDKSWEELSEELDKECWGWSTTSGTFLTKFRDYFYDAWCLKEIISSDEYDMISSLIYNDTLISNIYSGESFEIPGSLTKTGKPFMVNKGCKAVKAIGKIAEACGMNMDYFEDFRKAHSRVLNQKSTIGTLCLSIHPLDYITMSDNDCGWTSCMCWMDEAGDYRIGTLEMMNSEFVVVAYLKASDNMSLYTGYEWNNKRWRQLIIVTPEMILGNKQYPYANDTLQGVALKWVKTLCEKAGYGQYEQEAFQISNHSRNTIKTDSVYFDICSTFMYNDIYDSRMAFLNLNRLPKDHYYINFSGPAVCTCCGCIIDEGNSCGTSRVACSNCLNEFYCDCCGEWNDGEPIMVDGRAYCECCYENELITCECCGDNVIHYRSFPIVVGNKKKGDDYSFFDFCYTICICDECVSDEILINEMYGGIYTVKNWYGNPIQVVYIEKITNEGLESEITSRKTTEMLKAFRDAKTFEERKTIFERRFDYY